MSSFRCFFGERQGGCYQSSPWGIPRCFRIYNRYLWKSCHTCLVDNFLSGIPLLSEVLGLPFLENSSHTLMSSLEKPSPDMSKSDLEEDVINFTQEETQDDSGPTAGIFGNHVIPVCLITSIQMFLCWLRTSLQAFLSSQRSRIFFWIQLLPPRNQFQIFSLDLCQVIWKVIHTS